MYSNKQNDDTSYQMSVQQRQTLNAALTAVKNGRADEFAKHLQTGLQSLTPQRNPLPFFVTESQSVSILQAHFDYGWDINVPESSLDPPWMGAISNGSSEEVIRWFLEHGADPNAYARAYAVTPLSRAVQFAPLSTVQLLFDYGGRADRGELVNYVCRRKVEDKSTVPILELLLEKGAPVDDLLFERIPELSDVTMFEGNPMWHCCITGNTNAVRLLLEHGADPYKKPMLSEMSPVDLARKNGYTAIVTLLLEAMCYNSYTNRP